MSHLDKFAPHELTVAEYQYWVVTARGKQITPGDLVVLPRVAYESFADVEAEPAVELFTVLGQLEKVALGKLGAHRINVIAAMMKDPFVHFHFFPRFEGPWTGSARAGWMRIGRAQSRCAMSKPQARCWPR